MGKGVEGKAKKGGKKRVKGEEHRGQHTRTQRYLIHSSPGRSQCLSRTQLCSLLPTATQFHMHEALLIMQQRLASCLMLLPVPNPLGPWKLRTAARPPGNPPAPTATRRSAAPAYLPILTYPIPG
jgi:hypothetical protein